jgi:hypothetical protein
MRYLTLVALAAGLLAWFAPPAGAQIISTMVPPPRLVTQGTPSTPGPGGPSAVAFHVMGGYTNWEFGFEKDTKNFEEPRGATVTGGRNGWLGAADVAVRAGENVSVGAGGFVNKVENLVVNHPGNVQFFPYNDTATINVFSVYGNVFYKHIGVQAGIVPIRSHDTFVIDNPRNPTHSEVDNNQNDFDLYLVGRWGATGTNRARWSAMVGGGLYQYGAREGNAAEGIDPSPSAPSLGSGFANASIGIAKGFSLDASFWYTARDKNYDADSTIGNSSQARFTVGVGYGR